MAVSRAVRLRECPLVELTLYLKEAIRNWLLHILSIPIQTAPCSVRLFTVPYFPVKSYRSTALTVTGGHFVIGFKYTERRMGAVVYRWEREATSPKPSPPQSTVQSDHLFLKTIWANIYDNQFILPKNLNNVHTELPRLKSPKSPLKFCRSNTITQGTNNYISTYLFSCDKLIRKGLEQR